ncbi:unnamed protein product, partial [Gulo gulo]
NKLPGIRSPTETSSLCFIFNCSKVKENLDKTGFNSIAFKYIPMCD